MPRLGNAGEEGEGGGGGSSSSSSSSGQLAHAVSPSGAYDRHNQYPFPVHFGSQAGEGLGGVQEVVNFLSRGVVKIKNGGVC
jgi:hypothetical protein